MRVLKNWEFITVLGENGLDLAIEGNVYNSKKYPHGRKITTSRIKTLDIDNGIVITCNSEYKLL